MTPQITWFVEKRYAINFLSNQIWSLNMLKLQLALTEERNLYLVIRITKTCFSDLSNYHNTYSEYESLAVVQYSAICANCFIMTVINPKKVSLKTKCRHRAISMETSQTSAFTESENHRRRSATNPQRQTLICNYVTSKQSKHTTLTPCISTALGLC